MCVFVCVCVFLCFCVCVCVCVCVYTEAVYPLTDDDFRNCLPVITTDSYLSPSIHSPITVCEMADRPALREQTIGCTLDAQCNATQQLRQSLDPQPCVRRQSSVTLTSVRHAARHRKCRHLLRVLQMRGCSVRDKTAGRAAIYLLL